LLALSILVAATSGACPETCRAAEDWRPGTAMRSSMVRLLAAASIVVDKTEYGFAETAYLGAFLREGRYSFMTMTLNEGVDYAFIGAGNDPARDLDIIIEDRLGRVVAQDVRDDAAPILEFRPARTQTYTLKLRLHAATAPCFCGMVLMKRGGWTVPVRNLDVAMDNMLAQCENVATQRAAKFLDVPGEWAVIGTILRPGASNTFTDIRLGDGRRVVTSGGDTVARDIDLAIFEDAKTPRVLDKDEDDDARPMVQCNASDDRRYGILIKNVKSDGGSLAMTALLDVQ
jgi:hypothetical protein